MKTLQQVQAELYRHKREITTTFHVREIGIFGSYVRGEQDEMSDVDILVDYVEAPGLFEFIRLKNYLSELLGVNVDLVMKTALKPAIGNNILHEVVSV